MKAQTPLIIPPHRFFHNAMLSIFPKDKQITDSLYFICPLGEICLGYSAALGEGGTPACCFTMLPHDFYSEIPEDSVSTMRGLHLVSHVQTACRHPSFSCPAPVQTQSLDNTYIAASSVRFEPVCIITTNMIPSALGSCTPLLFKVASTTAFSVQQKVWPC